jgi:hypothetical protein
VLVPFDKPDVNCAVRDESGAGNDRHAFGAKLSWTRLRKVSSTSAKTIRPRATASNPVFCSRQSSDEFKTAVKENLILQSDTVCGFCSLFRPKQVKA